MLISRSLMQCRLSTDYQRKSLFRLYVLFICLVYLFSSTWPLNYICLLLLGHIGICLNKEYTGMGQNVRPGANSCVEGWILVL